MTGTPTENKCLWQTRVGSSYADILVLFQWKVNCNVFCFFQDLPLGLMDDIYDWSSKFAERVDDLEEVKFSSNSSVTCIWCKMFLPCFVGCHAYN